MTFELVDLKNGLRSLRSIENNETFHPVTGPLFEASHLHVKQQRVRERAVAEGRFVLWDVGFGAAANCVATLNALDGVSSSVEIHSFDKTLGPIEFALENAEALGYLLPYREVVGRLVKDGFVRVGCVDWFLHQGDFRDHVLRRDLPEPSGIFYDPYSSVKNQEMWNIETFGKLRTRVGDHCLLTNYTRSTSVRVTLLLAGFAVGYGWGVGEKDQTTVAAGSISALEHPLERNWLEKVRISRNSGPMRGETYPGPISAEDFAALEGLEQFWD